MKPFHLLTGAFLSNWTVLAHSTGPQSPLLASYLWHQNFTVETQLVAAATQTQHARHNILAYSGKTRQTRTLVTSHIDTVPPYWPYERRGAAIWGRGSVDAKGSVATQIKAVEALLSPGAVSEGVVPLLFVVRE